MMLSQIWAKITGSDKGKRFPEQQGTALGRPRDYFVAYPYSLYCNAPDGSLFKELSGGSGTPVTVKRPSDLDRGEPAFFHPETNTRIIPRNDGSLDIITSQSINMIAPIANLTGDLRVEGDIYAKYGTPQQVGVASHTHTQPSDSSGDAEQPTNAPTSGT